MKSDKTVLLQCVYMPFWWTPSHPQIPDVTDQYLASYDPAAENGQGWEWTKNPALAKRFANISEAMATWQQVNPERPVRPSDGKPNRPLTAFTVAAVPLDGVARES